MAKSLRILGYFLIIALVLNFLWEIGQAGLYQPHYEGFSSFIFVHFRAALGDVVIISIIYFITALIRRNKDLIIKLDKASFFLFALLGFAFAVAVEKYALAAGRWSYNELMPVLPILKVGLAPTLQLTIISPLTAYLVSKRRSR